MGSRSEALKDVGDDFAWALLDAAPDATLVVSESGEIVFVNDHAGELFGYEPDELLGRVVEDLVPNGVRAVHRAHRTRFRAAPTVRMMGAGLDLSAVRSDGSELPVEISLSPVQLDGGLFVIAAVRDITQRVRTEEFARRVLRTLDATDDGVFIYDAESLRYLFVNAGACRLVGYASEELLAMTPLHLDPYTTEREYRRLVESLVRGETDALVRQANLLRKDGREVPVEKTLRIAQAGVDGSTWVISLARDVSARLAAEHELRESQRSLEAAERRVAIADDRARIARDLHDVVIQRLFAEGLNLQTAASLLDEPHPARRRIEAAIDGIDTSIRGLRGTIFSLQAAPDRTVGGFRGQLLEVVDEATAALGFEPRLQLDGPPSVVSGPVAQHLLAVLREALSNIGRHAHAAQVRITIDTRDAIELRVVDDGVGMPEAVMGGRGLRNLAARAEQLGGTFSIVRRAGEQGSILTWSVPQAAAAPGE